MLENRTLLPSPEEGGQKARPTLTRIDDDERDELTKKNREKTNNDWTTRTQTKLHNNLDIFWMVLGAIVIFISGALFAFAVLALLLWGFKTPLHNVIAAFVGIGGAIVTALLGLFFGKFNLSTAPGTIAQKFQMLSGIADRREKDRKNNWDDDGNTIPGQNTNK